MDWDNPPENVAQGMGYTRKGPDIAQTWALKPAAWSQFAVLVTAFAMAWRATRRPRPAPAQRSATHIRSQDVLRPATRRMAAKAAAIATYSTAFLVLMNAPDTPLTSLAILGGAGDVGFAVEYRGHATSDGKNRLTPQALLATRTALKAHDIEIPVPQQVMRPGGPGAAASPAP